MLFFRKYKETITSATAIVAILFSGTGLYLNWNSINTLREESFLKFRAFVNIRNIKFDNYKLKFDLENNGITTANSVIIGFAEKNKEPIPFISDDENDSLKLKIKDENIEREVSFGIMNVIGDINPNSNRTINTTFTLPEKFQDIENGSSTLILEIVYFTLNKPIQHFYFIKFDKNKNIYIKREYENTGNIIDNQNNIEKININRLPGYFLP